MSFVFRAGKCYQIEPIKNPSPVWNQDDINRAITYQVRFTALGVPEDRRRWLVPMAVWRRKNMGIRYDDAIEEELNELIEGTNS